MKSGDAKIPFLSASSTQQRKYAGREYKKCDKYEEWSLPWYSLLIASAISGLVDPQSASISLLYLHGIILHWCTAQLCNVLKKSSFVWVKTASWWFHCPLALSLLLIHLPLTSSSGTVPPRLLCGSWCGTARAAGAAGRKEGRRRSISSAGAWWDLQLQDSAAAPRANGSSKAVTWPPDFPAKYDGFLTSSSLESIYSHTVEIQRLYTSNLLEDQKISPEDPVSCKVYSHVRFGKRTVKAAIYRNTCKFFFSIKIKQNT